ncbi:DNA replication/repair protein RecF [Streptomyces sp. NP160]|uniref:DNA replication/repair protein RecF n=1 Tax=Streptomyces sp. NP160 TaxID=2586637 RepID=UPI001118A2AF|nr:DNA replication/repair protein RecF [Streptomyces sp. NP160]TNM69034.1 DNA replication/repair protein RecF [Streptomyces sp. NP160]
MHVTHLSLVDFRNYETAEVALAPGPTALVGPNGQGKTNLVEAVGYVATLGSHRAATDAPLVRAGAERAVVRAAVDRAGRSTLVEVEISPGRANRARLNRAPLSRAREVLGSLRTVLFAPEDLALVKGEPDGRRRFMDEALVALAPRLAGVRSDLDRVLKQRGALLRQAAASRRGGRTGRPSRASERAAQAARESGWQDAAAAEAATLDVWDTHLATVGAELLAARLLLVRRLHPHVARAYAAVSGASGGLDGGSGGAEGPVRLSYRSTLPLLADLDLAGDCELPPRAELAQALLEQMAQVRAEELERGTSLVGPQRDDLLLELSGLPARGYASHGESWSYALALRLGLYELLCGDGPRDPASEPVLVLDDVFAELDAGRRQRLAALVAPAEQVLITAAVAEDVPPELAGRRLQVRAGTVEV